MAPGGGFDPVTLALMAAMFFVMWFFMIRPQAKKAKDQRNFIEALKKGDKIITLGGIHGEVIQVNDNTVLMRVEDGMKLKIEKSAISLELSKNLQQPVKS